MTRWANLRGPAAAAVILTLLIGDGFASDANRDDRHPPAMTQPSSSAISPTIDGEIDAPVPATDTTAQAVSASSSFSLPWASINAGSARSSSASYEHEASLGQPVVGEIGGTNFQAKVGFWYGVDADFCSCPCHADPECDGLTNVLDVVRAVNVAFRGAAPVFDPVCPRERTDVDCGGFTDVIDVVTFVNVAFRGGLPSVNFSDPCP